MLVVFLILFTTVRADSDEDKYIDLLPDEEKQEFLEKVARRILKDAGSTEAVANVQSGEVDDAQLKQHTEYVKSVLKEEQENIRRNKGDVSAKEEKPATDDLGVKPLASLKVSLFNERQDLTLRKERGDADSDKDTIKVEIVTDNVPIIKRSVQYDKANKSNESEETIPETLKRVSQTNITSEKLNEVETANEKFSSGKSDAKILSEKGPEKVKSTNAKDGENGTKPVGGNKGNLSESAALNGSVQGIHEESRRSNNEDSLLAGNATESHESHITEKATVNKSVEFEHNNVSIADKAITTITYPFEGSSAKGNDTESTTTDIPLLESTTETTENIEKDSEPIFKSRNATSNDTETKTTKSAQRSTINNETTKSVPETTASVLATTENVSEITRNTKIIQTEAETKSTYMTTERTTKSAAPVVTTKEIKIVVEEFTSAPVIPSTVTPNISEAKNPMKVKKKSKSSTRLLPIITTATPLETEESLEATTQKTINHKIVVHKASNRIVGPRAKKIAEAVKESEQNNNFIELQKVFYDNNNKVKVGKEYHVFEVPADASPFVKEKEPVAEQPYYVPIYNYSPNNAYFNPKNRLGPNAGDSSTENLLNDDDDLNELDRTETLNVKMEYDRKFDSKRKKFGGKQTLSQTVTKKPLQVDPEAQSQVNPEDYMDSDYYFGRVRKLLLRKANGDFNKFPNSDENEHPAHSIQEGSLKDHVRAVRNILFQQKSFGLLEKDKYGESIERGLRMGRKRTEKKDALRKSPDKSPDTELKTSNGNDNNNNGKGKDNENHITIDHYFGKEKPTIITDMDQKGLSNTHFQKIGYLKNQNDTKAIYVMDDVFKSNVEKYIQAQRKTPASPLQERIKIDRRDKIIAYLRMEDRQQRAEKNTFKKQKKDGQRKARNTGRNDKDILDNAYETPAEQALNLKVNVRRNDVVKISVYLQVLEDMVTLDNKALVQYDWLGTTVDIQASLQKLFELTSLVANEENVHPADMEILKYVLFLQKLASEIIEANDIGAQLRSKFDQTGNSKKKSKSRLQKEKGLINKVWLYLRKEVPEVNEQGALKNLNDFLMDVEDGLFDLHDAIKNIAKITKYKKQHWYQNLKDLYITTDEKHLLELLLHMTALRLFSMIEESAKNGLEDDYVQYMKQNRKHCKKTLEEMMFVMEVLGEYSKFVEYNEF